MRHDKKAATNRVQTSGQTDAKGGPGWAGRLACGRHVLGLTHGGPGAAAAGDGAVSHYRADRRTTLASKVGIAALLITAL